MPNFRVSLIFACKGKGWSEIYSIFQLTNDPGGLNQKVRDLVDARMPLAGTQTSIGFARIVNLNQKRVSNLLIYNPPRPGDPNNDTDNPETCLNVRAKNADRSRSKNIFMRGIWDSQIVQGGTYTPNAAWNANLAAFEARLKQDGWGWEGVTPLVSAPLTALTQAASGQIQGTVPADTFDAANIGKKVPLRFSGINQPGNLNGSNPVTILSRNTFITVKRIAMLPWDGTGRVTGNQIALNLIDVILPVSVSERKTGRVFGVPRGRQPARRRA